MTNPTNRTNTFPIVESFYSVQGEGYHTGKPAYFIRLGGCNVLCGWCDVKESWNPNIHERFTIEDIVKRVMQHPAKSVVVTGGEPLMNDLTKLTKVLNQQNIQTYLETSGTFTFTGDWDWVCLSPKQHHAPLDENFARANELKVIIDTPVRFQWAEECRTKVNSNCKLYLQPEWSRLEKITPEIIEYIKANPEWNISIQTHKYINIP